MNSKNKKIKRKTYRKNKNLRYKIKSRKKIQSRKKIKSQKKKHKKSFRRSLGYYSGGSDATSSAATSSDTPGTGDEYQYKKGEWVLEKPDGDVPLYEELKRLSEGNFENNKKIYSLLDGKIKFVTEGTQQKQRYFNTPVEDGGDWYLSLIHI